jgi:hypothetical protein
MFFLLLTQEYLSARSGKPVEYIQQSVCHALGATPALRADCNNLVPGPDDLVVCDGADTTDVDTGACNDTIYGDSGVDNLDGDTGTNEVHQDGNPPASAPIRIAQPQLPTHAQVDWPVSLQTQPENAQPLASSPQRRVMGG